ncbi:uncharacterized protein [Musca autumnalis]|uniref:uncharacterized protein n=1 Tax=Musca autumnalis TaxID=221902 RepID=UPI003CEE2EF8
MEEQNNENSDRPHNADETIDSRDDIYNKSQSLIDLANKTFHELCKTLENEQTKLSSLEERRKKLHEEMQQLKADIEKEKRLYETNLLGSVSGSLKAINHDCSTENGGKCSGSCNKNNSYEPTAQEQAVCIKQDLQDVLEECIAEQKGTEEVDLKNIKDS